MTKQVWHFEKAGHNLRSEVVQDIQEDVDRYISITNITLIGFNSMKEMMVSKHLASRAPEHPSDSDGDSLYEVLQDHNRIYIELILTMCSGML